MSLLNLDLNEKELNDSYSVKGDVLVFLLETLHSSVVVRHAIASVLFNVHDVFFSSEKPLSKGSIK